MEFQFRDVMTLSCSTGCLIKTTELRSSNGCLIKTLAISAMRGQDTMETIAPGQASSQMCVRLRKLFVFPQCNSCLTFSAGLFCSHLLSHRCRLTQSNDSVFSQQMLPQTNQADNDFLSALLTGGDSVSDSPLWSPSPSDSGISEDPPSDQMDSPQRPESPPEDAHCFAAGPKTKAALEANNCTDLSESTTKTQHTCYDHNVYCRGENKFLF